MARGSFDLVFMYWAVACATRRTLPNVKSSAMMPRQPSVPNLICWAIGLKVTGLPSPLERVDALAYALRPIAPAAQQSVVGVDDDQVLEPDRRDEAAVAEHQAAGGIDEHGFSVDRVAARVGVHSIAELGPVPDVGPVKRGGHEQQSIGLLHDRSIDDLDSETAVELSRRLLVARLASGDDVAEAGKVSRSMTAQLFDEGGEPPRKPGQGPEVPALTHETSGAGGVRLFDEALDTQCPARQTSGGVDVTESGRGKRGLEAHRHEVVAGRGGRHRCPYGLRDQGGTMHHMVSGQGDHHRVWKPFAERERRQPVCVGGAARGRLEDELRGVHLGQDARDDLALPDLRQDEYLVGHSTRPVVGGPKQRPAAIA